MRNRNKIGAAFGATLMVGASLAGLSTSAQAASYSAVAGECLPFGSPAAWTSDFDITFSPAAPNVGDVVTVSVDYVNGPSNGPIPLAAGDVTATGVLSLGGALTGTSALASVGTSAPVAPWAPMPGGTLEGTFVAKVGVNSATFSAMTFEGGGVAIPCTPGAGVTESVTVVGPTITLAAAGAAMPAAAGVNHTVPNMARAGDTFTVDATVFTGTGTGTLELCDTDGTNCEGTGTVSVTNGVGTGSLTVPTGAGTGDRILKATVGTETAEVAVKILANATLTSNLTAGGAGSVLTLTGSNFDPGYQVVVTGTKPPTGFPPIPVNTGDAPIAVTADAAGTFSTQFTVNDAETTAIQASQPHRVSPAGGIIAVTPNVSFTFSGDSCTAKVADAATGNCSMVQTVKMSVTAGDLTMAKDPGDVVLDAIQLDGTEQVSTGTLRDVTVADARGGDLGWAATGTFSGLTAPGSNVDIAPTALEWAPTCVRSSGDDTLTAGGSASFADSTTALPLCSVATTGLGADGASGGEYVADADLELTVPAFQRPGDYVGTLTITLS